LTQSILRVLLFATILVLLLLAFLYLRSRRLAWHELVAWGLLAFLLPVLGPILVFTFRPGTPNQS
jgi:membrane-bound metal-dependent hydrolase YbcI (DUF457 family)